MKVFIISTILWTSTILSTLVYYVSDYDVRLLFRWLFIPWLQGELDAYKTRLNTTRKRRDRNKILPQGVPLHIYHNPEQYDALDFKVSSFILFSLSFLTIFAP